MPIFFDSKGKSYQLNQPIGRGGEGTVFFCPEDLSIVAKIYHEPINEEKAEKLRWMAANSDERLLKVAAWIVDTLHDSPDGRVVGFLMPNVRAKEIHELYSLKSRRVHFPDATWEFLVHAAANVARAFHNLHGQQHVMGDVNHGNCVVLADGTVKLIDCDSYSIKTDKMRYRCEVGVATHLAPELQGVDLGEVERSENHDNFGLAVIVFQLLFLGRHPFAGNYLGTEDKSLEDCIREKRFAYGDDNEALLVRQPPGTLSLDQVSPRIAAMFGRAFLTDDRPTPREWIEALEDLGHSLKKCSVHIGHDYFNELTACPWCSIETKTGLMLFPFVSTGKTPSEQSFNVFTVEGLLASLEIPEEVPRKLVKPSWVSTPSGQAAAIRKANRSRLIAVSAIQVFVVLIFTVFAGAGVGFLVGAILMIGFLVVFHSNDRTHRESIESELDDAQLKWKQLEREWESQHRGDQIENDIETIRDRVAEHHDIQKLGRERIRKVTDEVFSYKLQRYLSTFRLNGAAIPNLSPGALKFVEDQGITTAADIEDSRLQKMELLDSKSREALIEWRSDVENKFEFNADKEMPEAELRRFEDEFTGRRRRVEREIEQLLVSVRSSTTIIQHSTKVLKARAAEISKNLYQAESDLAAMGTSTPLIVSLIFITALIPMFGAALQPGPRIGNGPFPRETKQILPENRTPGTSIDDDNYQVIERLSDEKIAVLSPETRDRSARSLYNQANRLLEDDQDYKAAEAKLRYALRFKKSDDALILLATVLFNQDRSKEALSALNETRTGLAGEEDALVLRARILIATGNPKLALDPLQTAYEMNPTSAVVLLYRGAAKRDLKDYSGAIESISDAINLDPSIVEAYYELGLTFVAKGDKESAQSAYEALLPMDPDLAEKLRILGKLEKK